MHITNDKFHNSRCYSTITVAALNYTRYFLKHLQCYEYFSKLILNDKHSGTGQDLIHIKCYTNGYSLHSGFLNISALKFQFSMM